MGIRHDYAINGKISAFVASGTGVLDRDWRKKKLQKWRLFLHFDVTTRLFDNAIGTITTKEHMFQFLVLKRNVQNVAAHFAFKTFVTVFIILSPRLDKDTLLSGAKPEGQYTSPLLSWIDFCMISKKRILYPGFKINEIVCPSKGILRTWHMDLPWGHW